jgi:hypothetical protein
MEQLTRWSISFNSYVFYQTMLRLRAEINARVAEQPQDQYTPLVLEGRMVLGPKY